MTPPPIHEAGGSRRTINPVPWILGAVAIACIAACAIGTAILAPVIGHARVGGQRSRCIDRLRLQGQAFELYCTDYDGVFPPAASWMDAIKPMAPTFGKKMFFGGSGDRMLRCPAASSSGYGYAMNLHLSKQKRSDIKNPAETPLTFDSNQLKRNATAAPPDLPVPARHGDRNCVCFADLHAKSVPAGQEPWHRQ